MNATSSPVSEGSRQTVCEQPFVEDLPPSSASWEKEHQKEAHSRERLQPGGHRAAFKQQLGLQAAEKSINLRENATKDMLKTRETSH